MNILWRVLCWFGRLFSGSNKTNQQPAPSPAQPPAPTPTPKPTIDDYDYERKPILTTQEYDLFQTLEEAIGPRYRVFPKAAYCEFVTCGDKQGDEFLKNKQAEFVLCKTSSLEPLLVIELDDGTKGMNYQPSKSEIQKRSIRDKAKMGFVAVPIKDITDVDAVQTLVRDELRRICGYACL